MTTMKNYITFEQIETISCPMDEQETSVSFFRTSDTMRVYTSDNTVLTDLKKRVRDNPEEWKCYEAGRNADGSVSGYFFEAPSEFLTFRSKKIVRELTEEQRAAMAERLKTSRSNKN